MQIVRVYSGDDGQSHFEEIDMAAFERAANDTVASLRAASDITFRQAPIDMNMDWHNAPRRQYVITLAGQWEVAIGDGSVRRFGPGDILVADDLTGQGHTTRSAGNEPRFTMIMPLPD
ncbi:MAG: hypothetical protein ACE5IZ_02125 [Dehalococcoidia bacterium]